MDGDVRAAPWTGSSMGTVTGALEFHDSDQKEAMRIMFEVLMPHSLS